MNAIRLGCVMSCPDLRLLSVPFDALGHLGTYLLSVKYMNELSFFCFACCFAVVELLRSRFNSLQLLFHCFESFQPIVVGFFDSKGLSAALRQQVRAFLLACGWFCFWLPDARVSATISPTINLKRLNC